MFSVPRREDTTQSHILQKFDAIIVFGEGPIRPVLVSSELTKEQSLTWNTFKQTPSKSRPDFWVIEEPTYLDTLATAPDPESLRQEWQHTGHFALRAWGRQNALAAGLALYEGITKKLILSGGKTKPRWTLDRLPKERMDNWPSEALLMRDVIVRNFGKLYKERYHQEIEDALCVEDASTNTLENFAYAINRNASLVREETHIGLLSSRHHLKRIALLAKLFSVTNAVKLSAQEMINTVKEEQLRKKCTIHKNEQLTDEYFEELSRREQRWIRGLEEPQYMTYWCGYLGDVRSPVVVQRALTRFRAPEWKEVAEEVFAKLGLDVTEFIETDLVTLAQEEPDRYNSLVQRLRTLKKPEYRVMPPPLGS